MVIFGQETQKLHWGWHVHSSTCHSFFHFFAENCWCEFGSQSLHLQNGLGSVPFLRSGKWLAHTNDTNNVPIFFSLSSNVFANDEVESCDSVTFSSLLPAK